MRAFAFLAVVLLVTASAAFAQSVFHPASEVAAGIFGSAVGGGNYTFNNSLVIADNLGVGTTSPANKLNVIGDINATGNVFGSQLCIGTDCKTSWSVGEVGPWNNSSTQIFVKPGYPSFINASNTLFVNGTSGYVGIGTTAPSQKLTVVGDVNITGKIYGNSSIPSGMVTMFNRNDCPAGWHAANGADGYIDLRDRFIVGAGLSYVNGSTGGASTHNHTIPNHIHSLDTVGGEQQYLAVTGYIWTTSADGALVTGTLSGGGYDQHKQRKSTTVSGGGGTTSTESSLPPYYALIYCIKV